MRLSRPLSIRRSAGRKVVAFARALLAITTAIATYGASVAIAEVPHPSAPEHNETRLIEVATRHLASFQRGDTQKKRFGRLEFRGGLVLSSPAKAFGGLSGLTIEPDGQRFMAISDEGTWLSGEIVYEGATPSGIREARMGPIRGIGGRPLDKKKDLDAEAMTLLEGSLKRGIVLIGFERNHRIGRFPVIDGVLQNPIGYIKSPPESRRMRPNKGFEALTVLQGGPNKGAPVAFSERYPDKSGQHTGWIWIRGEPHRLALADIGGFEVTDAASLPDGTLLILERRFRWTEGVKMRIRRLPPQQLRPGIVMQGETLIEADLSYEIDNMEGLAIHRTIQGETVLTLVSDDNFNPFLQRTILLQFTLLDE